MTRSRLVLAAALLLSTAASAEPPHEHTPAKNSPLFDKLAALAGTWTTTHEGKTLTAIQSRVSSNGSVIIETMFPGSPHEMTNVYHQDGEEVVVTHYCAIGNQPPAGGL